MTTKKKKFPVLGVGVNDSKIVAYVNPITLLGDNPDGHAPTANKEAFALSDANNKSLGLVTIATEDRISLQFSTPKDSILDIDIDFTTIAPKKRMESLEWLAANLARILAEKEGISPKGVFNCIQLMKKNGGWAQYTLATPDQLNEMEIIGGVVHFKDRKFTERELEKYQTFRSRN